MKIDMNDPRFAPPPFRPIEVAMSMQELAHAAWVGQCRHFEQRKRSQFDPKILEDGVEVDIMGAQAEKAVAKAFGLPWDGAYHDIDYWCKVWRTHGHDVSGLEIRSTPKHFGRLIIHEPQRDHPGKPFILVRSHRKPVYEIVGWYWAGYAQVQPSWWEDLGYGKPAFYVPTSLLYDPQWLPRYLPWLRIPPPPQSPPASA